MRASAPATGLVLQAAPRLELAGQLELQAERRTRLLRLFYIVSDDAAMRPRAFDARQIDIRLRRKPARQRRGEYSVVCMSIRSRRILSLCPILARRTRRGRLSPLFRRLCEDGASAARVCNAVASSPSDRSIAMGVLTGTPSEPSATMIFPIIPSSTASTSIVALSVSISAIASPEIRSRLPSQATWRVCLAPWSETAQA